jgi:hypothetical protein
VTEPQQPHYVGARQDRLDGALLLGLGGATVLIAVGSFGPYWWERFFGPQNSSLAGSALVFGLYGSGGLAAVTLLTGAVRALAEQKGRIFFPYLAVGFIQALVFLLNGLAALSMLR